MGAADYHYMIDWRCFYETQAVHSTSHDLHVTVTTCPPLPDLAQPHTCTCTSYVLLQGQHTTLNCCLCLIVSSITIARSGLPSLCCYLETKSFGIHISQRGDTPFVYRDGTGWPASLPYIRKIHVSVAIGTQSGICLHKRVHMVKNMGVLKK